VQPEGASNQKKQLILRKVVAGRTKKTHQRGQFEKAKLGGGEKSTKKKFHQAIKGSPMIVVKDGKEKGDRGVTILAREEGHEGSRIQGRGRKKKNVNPEGSGGGQQRETLLAQVARRARGGGEGCADNQKPRKKAAGEASKPTILFTVKEKETSNSPKNRGEIKACSGKEGIREPRKLFVQKICQKTLVEVPCCQTRRVGTDNWEESQEGARADISILPWHQGRGGEW